MGGSSPTGDREARRATMVIELSPKTERDRSQGELEPVILDQLATVPDIRAYFVNERGERELALGVMGMDGAAVSENARKIQSQMAATGKFRALTSNAALDRPEIIIEPSIGAAGRIGHHDRVCF